jgi:branched-subunit amino acid transport protein
MDRSEEGDMRGSLAVVIAGMAVVTFLPRFLPMAFLSRWQIPPNVKRGLEYIPAAVLSALVFPSLFFDGSGNFGVQTQLLLPALPVFVFAWKVRSLWGSVILGMLLYWGLGFLL